ncbi:hypothetical protein [Acinetobacter thermotolerans]|uniref:hypothetical protein n=1 Tax=Acinetobacter thermotolerans TaxID=3151487 RepID=UPI00325B608E
MTLVIKSDLSITNPKLGKLLVKRILSSGSLIKSTLGDINNTQTDAIFGGVPTNWFGDVVLFEYFSNGVENRSNGLGGTCFLNTETFKNSEISFEVSKLDNSGTADIYLDLRKLVSAEDNYCIRIRLNSTGYIMMSNRYSSADTIIQNRVDIEVGDKIKVQLVDNGIQLRINDVLISNNQLTTAAQVELNRSGNFGLAKGTTTAGKVGIKNLIVTEIT